MFARISVLETWGLKVDIGRHASNRLGYLAGTDAERLEDLNAAFRDPEVRAVFATQGGKGSYRIADRLDFPAIVRDPKYLIGFSDITALHLMLCSASGLVGIHGALVDVDDDSAVATLRDALMSPDFATVAWRRDEPTSALTTEGSAAGRLIGGNLDMVSTMAGWGLPSMEGAILFIEATNMYIGQVDRQLTALRKGGHLRGLTGVALGQFTGFELNKRYSVIDVLREHMTELGVPVLGGLPLGHGSSPMVVPIGARARIDTAKGTLSFGC